MVKHLLEEAGPSTPSKRRRSASSAPPLPPRPCDSPSNPFGRKRVQSLVRSLPPSTPFSKHLPLRFQLVRLDRPSPRLNGGVHRIVQVPTNYTFMHLRCLIAFLFGNCYSMLLRKDPHLFEVKRKIELLGMNYKPGQVKAGQTWAKLSSTMDPCRYRPELDSTEFVEGASSTAGGGDDIFGHGEEEEPGEWKWHAEEDFTLERAWPKGCEHTRAIIYHHDRTTQVHITINTLPGIKRKGCSNTPYVFVGRGLVTLSPPSLAPKPIFAESQSDTRTALPRAKPSRSRAASSWLKSKYQRQDAEGEVDPEASHSSHDDSDDDNDVSQQGHEPDNVRAALEPEDFNDPESFPRFFSRCQRLARSRLQFGSSFGLEYDVSSSSSSEDESDRGTASPSVLLDLSLSSPTKHPEGCSSPATSLFGSAPPANKASKARGGATPPPRTSSPGPSSPTSSPVLTRPSTHRSSRHWIRSSPGNIFETHTSLSSPKKRRHSSVLLHHLPFHPSPSGFPKYTPMPARGQLHRMRLKRIEKRVERMKSLEWLKVPDEDDDKKKRKKEEEVYEREKGKEKDPLMPNRRAAPGGVLEMGISRGKRPLPGILVSTKTSSTGHQFGDEPEV